MGSFLMKFERDKPSIESSAHVQSCRSVSYTPIHQLADDENLSSSSTIALRIAGVVSEVKSPPSS